MRGREAEGSEEGVGIPDLARLRWEQMLATAVAEQERLEALRPSTPKHAPLAETELAGKLVGTCRQER